MSRYPRAVRAARVKCVSCNAPAAESVDGGYICVECGRDVVSAGETLESDGGHETPTWPRLEPSFVRSASNGQALAERPTGNGQAFDGVREADAVDEASATESVLLGPDSAETPQLSVVIPTMNEEEGIGECIDRVIAAVEELGMTAEVIVSDDSTDATPDIAREKGAIVVNPDGKGYGYAYTYAFRRARGDLIAIGDADTTYDFAELPSLVEPVRRGEADMVMGTRLGGTILPGAMPPLHKYVGNPLLTKFLNVFYDVGVSDAHSGMRVITRDALDRLELRTTGMEFASEMIMDAGAKGLRIEEVPITYHPRKGEAKLDSFRDGWRHVKFMLVNAPTYLFAVPGTVFGLVGVLMMALSLFGVGIGGVNFGMHTMIAGSLLAIVGFQIGTLSLSSSLAANPIRKPTDPITRWIEEKFRLEHGATLGVALFGVGATYATYLVLQWVQSGYTQLPLVPENMLAFTLIVIGVQMVFTSFHLSTLSDNLC